MAKRRSWIWIGAIVAVLVAVVAMSLPAVTGGMCPGSQYYCPGVGCVSGMDKCLPGHKGGASAVFSKETFVTERMTMKQCPGGIRTDGPCLMEFPDL